MSFWVLFGIQEGITAAQLALTLSSLTQAQKDALNKLIIDGQGVLAAFGK